MKTRSIGQLVLFFGVIALLTFPQLVVADVMNASNSGGTSSFNTAINWTLGAAPTSGNDYFTSNYTMRTPSGSGAYTFEGDSLQIDGGGTLAFKGYGLITVDDLKLAGGQVSHWDVGGGGQVGTLTGNIDVISNSTLNSGNNSARRLVIDSVISGSGNLIGNNGAGVVQLNAANTLYTGVITVTNGGTLRITNNDALGSSALASNTIIQNPSGPTGGSGTTLQLENNITVSEAITLAPGSSNHRVSIVNNSGNNILGGPITVTGSSLAQLTTNSGSMTVNGDISGPSFTDTLFLRGSGGSSIINGTIDIPNAKVAKTDGGTWTINSSGNSWGNTTVAVGTLAIGATDALPTVTILTMGQGDGNNATFNLNGNDQTIAGLAFNSSGGTKNVTTTGGASTLTFANTGTYDYGGNITGAVSLVMDGSGQQKLSGTVNISGIVTLDSGTLDVASDQSWGGLEWNAGSLINSSASTKTITLTDTVDGTYALKIVGGLNPPGDLTFQLTPTSGGIAVVDGPAHTDFNSNIDLGQAADGDLVEYFVATLPGGSDIFHKGVISGTGGVQKTGSGTLKYDGNSTHTYTGPTVIDDGDIFVQNKPGGRVPDTSVVVINGPGRFHIGGSTTETIAGLSGNGSMLGDGGGPVLTIDTTSNQTFSGVISGDMSLVKTGSAIQRLFGTNTYTGGTTIEDGTLRILNDRALGAIPGSFDADNVIFDGGTLKNEGAGFTLDANRGITLASGGGRIDVRSGTTITIPGAISGSGNLEKNDGGTLVLAGDSTFTGTIAINNGTLQVDHTNALGAATNNVTMTTGETLQIVNGSTGVTVNNISGTGNLLIDDGSMTITGGLDIDNLRVGYNGGTGDLTAGGAVSIGSGSGNYIEIGRTTITNTSSTGTVDFSGATSVTINVGNMDIGTMPGSANPGGHTDAELLLSASGTNAITAGSITLGDSPGAGNTGHLNHIQFGESTNTVATDTFIIGGRKNDGLVDILLGGSLTITGNANAGADLVVGQNNVSTGTTSTGTLDLTGATVFNATLDQFHIGNKGDNSNGKAKGTVTLAAMNNITANEIIVGRSGNSGATGSNDISYLHLGADNNILADTIIVGEKKTIGQIDFIAPGSTLNLGNSTNRSEITLGFKNVDTGSNAAGIMDLRGGTANIYASDIMMGRETNTAGSGTPSGTLILGDGMLNVSGNVYENPAAGGEGNSTLTVLGDQTFTIGGFVAPDTFTIGLDGVDGSVTYTAAATAQIGEPTNLTDLYVGRRNENTGTTFQGTLDLSAVTTFNAWLDEFSIGTTDADTGGAQGQPRGVVTLATNNNIDARIIEIGNSTNVGLGGFNNRLILGSGTNNIDADTVVVGGDKSNGTIGGSMSFPGSGTLNLTGSSGAAADLYVGQQEVGTGGGARGLLDLSGGTFNATLDQFIIGSKPNSASGTTGGAVIMDDGMVTANSLRLGVRTNAGTSGTVWGRMTQNGGIVRVDGDVTISQSNSYYNLGDGDFYFGNTATPHTMTVDQGANLQLTSGAIMAGGTMNLASTATLNDAELYVDALDVTGSGQLTQTGGLVHAGTLTVAPTNRYQANGGTVEFEQVSAGSFANLDIPTSTIRTGSDHAAGTANVSESVALTSTQRLEIADVGSRTWSQTGNNPIQVSSINPIGRAVFTGDLSMQAGTVTAIDLDPSQSGSFTDTGWWGVSTPAASDTLDVAGQLTLGGTLDLTALDNSWARGQEFNILDFDLAANDLDGDGEIDTHFDEYIIPHLYDNGSTTLTHDELFSDQYLPDLGETGEGIGGMLAWDFTDLYTQGIIRVVPEPSTWTLFGLGMLALALYRRRKK